MLKPSASVEIRSSPAFRRQKRVAILQSSYIPWKGYFDIIRSVDEFVLYDEVQYTRRDWRNRNRIKGPQGALWLSIPVKVKGRFNQRIDETEIGDAAWNLRHWKTIQHHYARARYFCEYEELFAKLYREATESYLSHVNLRFIQAICEILGVRTKMTWSTEYESCEGRTERLVAICRQAGASEYVSGPSARSYMDESLFTKEGIAVRYVEYAGYPEYRQLHSPFDHHVSVIDLIFNEGCDAARYMRCL